MTRFLSSNSLIRYYSFERSHTSGVSSLSLSTEIHPGLETHIEEHEKVLAANRHGRHDERLDPEAR